MKPRVYLETTVISYLTARPSRDIVVAAHQELTRLLTWNCAHIANAAMRRAIDDVCVEQGYEPTVLCTPEELIEE
ncbi:MAG: hypothetical protein ACHQ9S_15045 [Candidatus Binatia bacterium]